MPLHPAAFKYVKPSEEHRLKMQRVRDAFFALNQVIEQNLPNGRGKALVTTNIQQAAMWANHAITRDDDSGPREGASIEL